MLRSIVSRQKKRYQENGFDLDLSYIRPNLIAMGYPAGRLERIYRNDIEDVYKFLEKFHKDRYMIYNLCSEKKYDHAKFHNRVVQFPIDDHNPPSFERIKLFCEDIKSWLQMRKDNVAVVHCKAGKGRTGVMICCYLIHDHCYTAEDALNYYADKRTHDKKGVTIPSQRRYVHYYEKLVKNGNEYKKTPLYLKSISLKPVPVCYKNNSTLTIFVYEDKEIVFTTYRYKFSDQIAIFDFEPGQWLKGDIKVELYNGKIERPHTKMKGDKIFAIWLNTYFIKHNSSGNSPYSFPLATGSSTHRKSPDNNSLNASNYNYKSSVGICSLSSSNIPTSGTNSNFNVVNSISNLTNSRSSLYEPQSASSSLRIASYRKGVISSTNTSSDVSEKVFSYDYALVLKSDELDKSKSKVVKWLVPEFQVRINNRTLSLFTKDRVRLQFLEPRNPSNFNLNSSFTTFKTRRLCSNDDEVNIENKDINYPIQQSDPDAESESETDESAKEWPVSNS